MKHIPQITVISDCLDENARGRQELRYCALFDGVNPTFIGSKHEIQAAGNLVDAIDATRVNPNKNNIFVVNVAHRGDKKYKNGIPFCFSKTPNGIIIGTPNCFHLVNKLGLLSEVFETDVFEVCSQFFSPDEALRISESQFRSFEYLPLLAKWLYEGQKIPSKSFEVIPLKGNFIWNIDNFSNAKTTVLCSEREQVALDYPFIKRLSDVPNDLNFYFVEGSSGFREERFLELVAQLNEASKLLNLSLGDKI